MSSSAKERALGAPFQPTAGSEEAGQRPGKPPSWVSERPPCQPQARAGPLTPPPSALLPPTCPACLLQLCVPAVGSALGTVLPPVGPRARPTGEGLSCPLPETGVPAVNSDLCPVTHPHRPAWPPDCPGSQPGSFRGCPCLSPRLLGRAGSPRAFDVGGREASLG